MSNKGSEWHKWDLHVHTPASIIQHFGANNDETWEKYIEDIEKLPSDLKVLGINDYLFLDGYKRLEFEKRVNGRLKNIDLLLPVIEFRIELFAGIDFKTLKRINLHVIFSNEVSIETITSQFLNTLEQNYKLNSGVEWHRAITRESIEELGKQVYNETPPDKRNANPSFLKLGFNNLNVDQKQIFDRLKKDCFRNKHLIAVGKTEWADLKWTDSSIATKKDILNKADIVFTASDTVADYLKAKESLKLQEVNDLLLDCSDAHYLSTSIQKDRIGNSYTWIKADLTFEGLKQVLYEPDKRVKISEINPYDSNKKICISQVSVQNSIGIDSFPISSQIINLNRDLICIIGGRGSGKSALFETIAFCFDQNSKSKENKQHTFVDFYKSKTGIDPEISIQYSDRDRKDLPPFNTTLKNRYEVCTYPFLYLGQNKMEEVANDQNKIHELAFDTIIKQTSFSSELYDAQTKIDDASKELINLNSEINSYRQKIKLLDAPTVELEHKKVKDDIRLFSSEETKGIVDSFNLARTQNDAIKKIEEQIGEIPNPENPETVKEEGHLYTLLNEFDNNLKGVIGKVNSYLFEINPEIQFLTIDFEPYKKDILSKKGLINKKKIQGEYQKSLNDIQEKLSGKTDVTIAYLESQKNKESELEKKIEEIKSNNYKLSQLKAERDQSLEKLHRLYEDFEKLYTKAIEQFNDSNKIVLSGVSLNAKRRFSHNKLFDALYQITDGRKSRGIEYLQKQWFEIEDLDNFDLITWDKSWIENPDYQDVFLRFDANEVDSIVYRNYNFLETEIAYEVETDDFKPISELSLGQKGTVLLKLYLSSGNNCPILIDQPEDHLDNEFIYKDLVQTIRDAKDKRQVIIVTHDANLVVNGDAEQVIVATYKDKKISHSLSGSLENTEIREAVTRILEGGDEAFKKREKKYQFST